MRTGTAAWLRGFVMSSAVVSCVLISTTGRCYPAGMTWNWPPKQRGMTDRTPLVNDGDEVPLVHDVAFVHRDLLHDAVGLRDDRDLHLHGLENDQRVALFDGVP